MTLLYIQSDPYTLLQRIKKRGIPHRVLTFKNDFFAIRYLNNLDISVQYVLGVFSSAGEADILLVHNANIEMDEFFNKLDKANF